MPLRAWLYRSGFARFSNTRYCMDTLDDTCILEKSKQFENSLRIQMYGDKYISKLMIMRLCGIPILKITNVIPIV